MHARSPADRRRAYERHVIPTPGRVLFQAALGIGTRVDDASPIRAPLLLVGGERDRIVPPAMVRANYRRYRGSSAVTALKVFPNRSHWLIQECGWDEVADYTLDWAKGHDEMEAEARPEAERSRPAR